MKRASSFICFTDDLLLIAKPHSAKPNQAKIRKSVNATTHKRYFVMI